MPLRRRRMRGLQRKTSTSKACLDGAQMACLTRRRCSSPAAFGARLAWPLGRMQPRNLDVHFRIRSFSRLGRHAASLRTPVARPLSSENSGDRYSSFHCTRQHGRRPSPPSIAAFAVTLPSRQSRSRYCARRMVTTDGRASRNLPYRRLQF